MEGSKHLCGGHAHRAFKRLSISPIWESTVLAGMEAPEIQALVDDLVYNEAIYWLMPLGSQAAGAGPQSQMCAFVRFAIFFLDPREEKIVLSAMKEAMISEIMGVEMQDLPALWSRWVHSVKELHNKRGGKDQWKLVLWSVTAGWHEVLGCEPERRRL
tara:strand:- start:87 stop:560 length:474 start_codon:yes stop_codon:yes gene_type:complete